MSRCTPFQYFRPILRIRRRERKVQDARKCGSDLQNCAFESRCFRRTVGEPHDICERNSEKYRDKTSARDLSHSDRFQKYRGNSAGPQRMEYPVTFKREREKEGEGEMWKERESERYNGYSIPFLWINRAWVLWMLADFPTIAPPVFTSQRFVPVEAYFILKTKFFFVGAGATPALNLIRNYLLRQHWHWERERKRKREDYVDDGNFIW